MYNSSSPSSQRKTTRVTVDIHNTITCVRPREGHGRHQQRRLPGLGRLGWAAAHYCGRHGGFATGDGRMALCSHPACGCSGPRARGSPRGGENPRRRDSARHQQQRLDRRTRPAYSSSSWDLAALAKTGTLAVGLRIDCIITSYEIVLQLCWKLYLSYIYFFLQVCVLDLTCKVAWTDAA